MYMPRRMEELFSDARPVWPFYGDAKLISDREGVGEDVEGARAGGAGGGDGGELDGDGRALYDQSTRCRAG